MKFTNSSNLFIAIIFIYLIAFVELNQINTSIKLGRKIQKKFSVSKSKSNIKYANHSPCVKLCKDINLQGECDDYCDDEYSYGLFKGPYRSVQVGILNLSVVLFSEKDFKGASLALHTILDLENFSPKSHMILKKNCAVVFDYCSFVSINFSAIKICDSETNINSAFQFEMKSIILAENTIPKIFDDFNFKGTGYQLAKSVKCLPKVLGGFKIKSIHIVDPNYSAIYMSPNPFINFIIGTALEITDNETNLTQCFPEEWKHQVKSDEVNNSDNNLQQWNGGMSSFEKKGFFGEAVLDLFCNFRQKVVEAISGLFSLFQRRRYLKSSFMELNSKRNMSKSLIKRTYNSYKNISSIKVKGIFDVLGSIFTDWINSVKEKVVGFINKIKEFFQSELFKKILKFVECVYSVYQTIKKIKEVFEGIKNKFETLKVLLTSNPIIAVITIVDFLVAFVCEYKQFSKAINFFKKAWNENNVKLKWLLYGKSIGKFLNIIGTAQTFSQTIYDGIQKSISK